MIDDRAMILQYLIRKFSPQLFFGRMDPREGCKFVSENATDVKIVDSRIAEIAKFILAELTSDFSDLETFCRKNWSHHLRNKVLDEEAVAFIFLCDAWNYCFWADPWNENFMIEFEGKRYFRSWGMVAAIARKRVNFAVLIGFSQNFTSHKLNFLKF